MAWGLKQANDGAPATEPITSTEAKLYLRVDTDADDDLIAEMVTQARVAVEAATSRCMITQTWEWQLDSFNEIGRIPLAPVSAVTIDTYNDAGTKATLDGGNYVLDKHRLPQRIRLSPTGSWPSHRLEAGIMVTLTCGYGAVDADPVHQEYVMLKQATLRMLGNLYESRQDFVIGQTISELPQNVHALVAPLMIPWQ